MSNVIASTIFCARSVDKAENENKVGRWAIAAGQAKKVVDYVRTLDNDLGHGANEAVNLLKSHAKDEKIVEYAGKAVDFASKNVNTLICATSAWDVVNAKDKQTALLTNATALGTMFLVENHMKNHLDKIPKIKGVDKIAEKITKFSKETKYMKGLPAIIHGTAFVLGSCTAYNVGEKFGYLVAGKDKDEVKREEKEKS
jgi:hypothetical protein